MKRLVSVLLTTAVLLTSLSFLAIFATGTSSENAVSETDPADSENIAYKKPTRSNSTQADHTLVTDGDTSTAWVAPEFPKYVDIDLLDNYDISEINLLMPTDVEYDYTVYGSLNGISFTRLYSSDSLEHCKSDGAVIKPEGENIYRIIRVNVTNSSDIESHTVSIREIKIHGTKSKTAVTPTREKLEFTSYEDWIKTNCGVDLSAIKDSDGNYDIKDTYTAEDTVNEVKGIVERLLGAEYNEWFEFCVSENPTGSGKSYFNIEDSSDGKIKISGNTGCDIAAGLNWYLKYFCDVSIAQETKQVYMPSSVVNVGEAVFKETDIAIRYAYNYCTLSYTNMFYGYDDWRRELDWLFLQGVNLILDINGTEAMWIDFLQKLSYNADEAKNFVSGYAFKAWWLMGNLDGYGGTVSDSWVYDTLELARYNQRIMTVMGASPALQTFAGAMPNNFGSMTKDVLAEKGYSDITEYLDDQVGWVGLARPNVLRTDYDGYGYIAQLFYDSQTYLYGQVTDYYCGDICHEGGHVPAGLDRTAMGLTVMGELVKSDADATWIMQRWCDNPMPEMITAFNEAGLTNIIVLDLQAAQISEHYKDTSFYGSDEFGSTRWILSSLDNLGGVPTMHGKLQTIVDEIAEAKKNSEYLAGIGITPEGTQNNPIYMDLYWEMVWRDEAPDVYEWTESYIKRRYGSTTESINAAWKKLLDTVYSADTLAGQNLINLVGKLPGIEYSGEYYEQDFGITELRETLTLFMTDFDSLSDSECYIYDAVDLMQTYLEKEALEYLKQLAYYSSKANQGTVAGLFAVYADRFVDLVELMDEVSAYSENQLLGKFIGRAYNWIDDSRTGEYDDYDYDNMTINAKLLISAWHTEGELIDYGSRLYNGLIRDYYYQSWMPYFNVGKITVSQKTDLAKKGVSYDQRLDDALDFINNDSRYQKKASAVKGDLTSRGLKAVYNYLVLNHYEITGEETDTLVKITAGAKSGYTRFNSLLSGVTDGDTVKNVADSLSYPSGYTLKAEEYGGGELEDGDALHTGSRFVLKNADGEIVDTLIIGSVVYAGDSDKESAKKLSAELEDFTYYAEHIDTSELSAEEISAINEAYNAVMSVTDKSIDCSLSVLKNMKREYSGAIRKTEKLYKSRHPASDKNGFVLPVIIISVCIVIFAFAVIVFVTKTKKKAKTRNTVAENTENPELK